LVSILVEGCTRLPAFIQEKRGADPQPPITDHRSPLSSPAIVFPCSQLFFLLRNCFSFFAIVLLRAKLLISHSFLRKIGIGRSFPAQIGIDRSFLRTQPS
jgi:hypothetical protein